MTIVDSPRLDERLADPAGDRRRPIAMSYGCPKCCHHEAHIIGSAVVPLLVLTRCPACGFISSHSVV
jgi:hypothetical protein